MPVPYTFATATGNIPLSHLDANFSNVSAYTNTAGTVTASAQPNVTSVGTLVSLSVTGNVTAARYYGDGGNLTGITATAVNAVNLLGTTLAPGVVTSSLTSVGTLGSLAVTDTITGGNLSISGSVTGNGYRLTAINAANITGTVATATTAGTVTTAAQPNITSVGNLSSLSVTGNITTGAYFIGDGSQLSNLPASSYSNSAVSAYLASGTNSANIITTGNVSGGNIVGNIVAPGTNQDVVFNRNGVLSTAGSGFNYNYAGNILYAPAASFSGDPTTGTNGLFAGHGSFTELGSDIMCQFTGNVNAYSQVNFQNINNQSDASGDYIVTADNGTDSTFFVDLGIGSSNYAHASYPAYGPNDSYLLNDGGNLLLNAQTPGKVLKVLVGGTANADIVTTISADGIDVTGTISATGNITGGNVSTNTVTANRLVNGTSNIAVASSGNINMAIGASPMITVTTTANAEATPRGLIVEGFIWGKANGAGQSGNVIGGNLKTSGLVSAAGNITGGNLSVGTGNITVGNVIFSNGSKFSSAAWIQIESLTADFSGSATQMVTMGNTPATLQANYNELYVRLQGPNASNDHTSTIIPTPDIIANSTVSLGILPGETGASLLIWSGLSNASIRITQSASLGGTGNIVIYAR